MKRLTLSSLLLSAAALIALAAKPASAEYFCSLATISSDSGISFLGGQELWSNQCTLAASKKLTISGTSPDTLASGKGAATVDITNSIFQEGSMLWYLAGSESTMSSAVPFIFHVHGNTFNRNAVFVLQGSFPKDSVIEIRDNIWVGISSPHSVYGMLAAHAIFFYTDSTQRLDERARISITGNTIPVSVSSVAYAIGINAPLSMYSNSKLEISGNDLSCTSTAANLFPAVIGWGYTSSFTIAGEDAAIVISDNKIAGGNDALGIYMPIMNSGGKAFHVNVTNNDITLQGTAHFPLRMRGLNIAKASKVFITDNKVHSVGSNGQMLITDMACGGSSFTSISNNKLEAYGGSPSITFENDARVAGTATLNIEFNTIARIDDYKTDAPGIQFRATFQMTGSSTTSISYNNLNANAFPPQWMVYSIQTTSKMDSARFFLCNNIHYGSLLTSFETYVTASIVAAMENQTYCLSRTTTAAPTTTTAGPTSTTTRATTTRDPSVSTTTAPVVIPPTFEESNDNSTSVAGNETVDANVTTPAETDAPVVTTTAGETDSPLPNSASSNGAALLCASALTMLIAALQ